MKKIPLKQQAKFKYGPTALVAVGARAFVYCVKHPDADFCNQHVVTSTVEWVDTDTEGNATSFGTCNTVYTAV